LSGGEAKGIWLNTARRAGNQETPSLFEVNRVDMSLMQAYQRRWYDMVASSGGIAFTLTTVGRLAAGLGATHILETSLTLDRNTGLPYLPGSSVKGLARAWGLIEVARSLGITIGDRDYAEDSTALNNLAEILMSQASSTLHQKLQARWTIARDAEATIDWFRFIFGSQENAGAVVFLDGIYYGGNEPQFASEVMTPHYVNYYTLNGGAPPTEEDSPNPVSFIAVDAANPFAFGLLPRQGAFAPLEQEDQTRSRRTALMKAGEWLTNGLRQLGIGGKTAAGYGFFGKPFRPVLVLS